MSEHTPVELIVAAFNEEGAAKEALRELKSAKRQGLIKIDNAAVLRRDEKNKLHIKEVHDMGGGKGAVLGGSLGLAVGLLAGPVGLAAGAGALIGGVAAKLRDGGFSDRRLKEIGDGLKPGTSAIVAVIEHRWVDELEALMAEAGADVATQALKAEIAQQLDAGRDVQLSVLSTESALSIDRTVVGDDLVEVDSTTITEEGVVSETVAATADAALVSASIVTDEGAAMVTAVATADAAGDESEDEESEDESDSAETADENDDGDEAEAPETA